ncbi:MAG: type II toxin-antitoxin system PemK/MazF family toxin [Ignavibacteria bacterium]|nr:type II toxin-antitoxin system PemK/MazF family toxin [Ignavibacteria bacterium]
MVSNDEYNRIHEEVVVCVITSNLFQDEYSIPLENSDLEYGLLPEKSVVKVHKLFTIHKSKILKKFSSTSEEYYVQVFSSLQKLFNISPKVKNNLRKDYDSLNDIWLKQRHS